MKRFGVIFPLAAAALWVGCSSCSGSDGSSAQQGDGSVPDLDAGTDGPGRDSPVEGSLRDRGDGSARDAFDAPVSAKPIWQDMVGTVGGCKVQRLANPQDVRVFNWTPCDSIPGCEMAVYDRNVLSAEGGVLANTVVRETPTGVIAALVLIDRQTPIAVLFTDAEGQAFDGYRTYPDVVECNCGIASLSDNRFGVNVCWLYSSEKKSSCGGILNSRGGSPVLFDVPPKLFGVPGGGTKMGDTRWLWFWVMPTRLTSVSSTDGSGFSIPVSVVPTGAVIDITAVDSSGPLFLVGAVLTPDGGSGGGTIVATDGISPAQPYLDPPTGSLYGAPGFAHSHVAWMRGIGQKSTNIFDQVEIWASPYSADPKQLVPEKIGDHGDKNLASRSTYGAGHGIFFVVESDGNGWAKGAIWDLAAKTKREVPYPHGFSASGVPGVTKTHVWGMIDETGINFSHRLLRFAIR